MKINAFDTETTGLPEYKQPSDDPRQSHIVEKCAAAQAFYTDAVRRILATHGA